MNEEGEEISMGEMQGIEFQSSMVLLRMRDPGFVDALDTVTENQMLDELHADLYADDGHFVCVDVDRVLVRDLAGKMWMPDDVTLMIGVSQTREHEFKCLGEDQQHGTEAHGSATRQCKGEKEGTTKSRM